MSQHPQITSERQSALLERLERVAVERAGVERSLTQNRIARQNAANSAYETTREARIREFDKSLTQLQSEFQSARNDNERRRRQDERDLETETTTFERTTPRRHAEQLDEVTRRRDSAKLRNSAQHQKLSQGLDERWQEYEGQFQQVQAQLAAARQEFEREASRRKVETPTERAAPRPDEPPLEAIARVYEPLRTLRATRAAKFFDEHWSVLIALFTTLLAIYPSGLLLGWGNGLWAAASVGAGAVVTVFGRLLAGALVRKHARQLLPQGAQALARAEGSLRATWDRACADRDRQRTQIDGAHRDQINELDSACTLRTDELHSAHRTEITESRERFAARRETIGRVFRQQAEKIEQKYEPAIAELKRKHAELLERLLRDRDAELERSQRAYDDGMQQLVDRWTAGLAEFESGVAEMNSYCDSRFPDWSSIDWSSWRPASDPAAALPFGRFLVDIDQYGEPPEDPRLKIEEPRRTFPAVLSFPERPSLLLEASDEGKQAAVRTMQSVMLRLLMAAPPGKVRFTIIDPEGLGQNFSMFMHLADFDEKLVGARIWTEAGHIQQQLADLTEHTENVIQKYLRNEFASIQEYNERAGEVAEPYRILVVANFPENFSDEAARRLVSIAASGPRCGVFTLISVDTRKKLPRDFFLDELEAHAATLQWTHNGFRPREPRLRTLPLSMDAPPEEPRFSESLRAIGKLAQFADRVEVPFAAVAPAADDECWRRSCAEELDVPLGRAGATKLQHLRLGKGVSQHVLVSGKTGSGKSTLLHALVTNVALQYSPDEVEFYLIDFKKGVEFKPYATHLLPHARVIAIESEREFGMSVLERLDEELRRRGDLFRSAGVQDLRGYRDARPDERMPRVLLIIDEFQELFVKDDKIASDGALLLDRLVRQGRAFGMHVLLGSQTLAGAYSLARSTIGQMAVRIALQCSEADAHLILSEDNTAARLLNRPGEAIYNNANGLLEGNHPFQIVWLSDSERVDRLRQVARLAGSRGNRAPAPIVFEGNVPAAPEANDELVEALRGGRGAAIVPRVWLGAAVAIKPATYIDLPRQSGANLLVVGPQEEMALGILGNAALTLAAQSRCDDGPAVWVLDGARGDSSEAGKWPRIAEAYPEAIRVEDPRRATTILAELVAELERREGANQDDAPARFLIIHHLARFRDLRRGEDDFGFSGFGDSDNDAPPKGDKLLQRLLRDGPAWGLHTLLWSDSFNTASRWLDRQTFKDIEQRVLFQMTAGDSSNLIDSPAAAQLGVHRAILHSEEHGRQEKFRPYATPDAEWLRRAAELLQAPSRR